MRSPERTCASSCCRYSELSDIRFPVATFVGGLVAGVAGLAAITVVVWCRLRGWPKNIQRAIFRPVGFAAFVVSAISLSVAGQVATETVKLYLFDLPLTLGDTWIGPSPCGRFDDAGFRRIVLLLFFESGISLTVPRSIFG